MFAARADLVEERGELYPPLLIPGSAVAQVHQVLQLLHCLDGGHLQHHSRSETTVSRFSSRAAFAGLQAALGWDKVHRALKEI